MQFPSAVYVYQSNFPPHCHPYYFIAPLNSYRKTNLSSKGRNDLSSPGASHLLSHPAAAINNISSPSNAFIKHCVKLRQSSSYRHLHGSVPVVGLTPIREILKLRELKEEKISIIKCLLLLDGTEVPKELENSSLRAVHVNSMVMKKLSGMQSIDSTEAVALMRIPSSFLSLDHNQKGNFQSLFLSSHRILVLDGIQDPGNLGTLLRSAMAFGWDGAFLLPRCCDPFNEKALRAARGASFLLPIVVGDWFHLELLTKNFQMKMLGGHPESDGEEKCTSVLSQDLARSLADRDVCLILGSEGHGLSERSKSICELLSIPMADGFESLNVSVAGGIFLFMLQSSRLKVI